MPHIPFGNSLTYCKLLDKGTPNSLDLAQHSPGLNLDLHSWPAAPSAGKEASLLPLSSLLPPDRRHIGSLLFAGEGMLFWNNTLCTGSSAGPALLHPSGKKKISAGILFCWNQNTSQSPADFARISLKKKVRKTRSSSSVESFFSMFEMQHSCFFFF